MRKSFTTALLVTMLGCGHGGSPPNATSSAQPADTIYTGSDIVTVNDAQPIAEAVAVAVKDGKILVVGTRAEVETAHKGAATNVVDLRGRTLTPGFVDGHAHFLGFGSQAVGAVPGDAPVPIHREGDRLRIDIGADLVDSVDTILHLTGSGG
jgi:hypothetical protein